MNSNSTDHDEHLTKLSRDEIESLCLMHVVTRKPGTPADIAKRLGFSPLLASAIETAMAALAKPGCIEIADGVAYATAGGREWFEVRLAEVLSCAANPETESSTDCGSEGLTESRRDRPDGELQTRGPRSTTDCVR